MPSSAQGEPADAIANILRFRKPLLLILDNFEQVVAHAEATIGRWRDRAPHVAFLVTSRTVLRLAGGRPHFRTHAAANPRPARREVQSVDVDPAGSRFAQRSLLSAIEWSSDLLPPVEQTAFLQLGETTPWHARVKLAVAMSSFYAGSLDDAREFALRALAQAEALGDPAIRGKVLHGCGVMRLKRTADDDYRALFAEALEAARDRFADAREHLTAAAVFAERAGLSTDHHDRDTRRNAAALAELQLALQS